MAVIRIQAQKDARCIQAVCQIRGDRRTQILRFDVNRFDGGVDLGDLRWVIKTTNALGKEDIFDPEVVEIRERTIVVDWLVDGSVTDVTGMASYELNGIDTTEEGQPVQWSGGIGSISVRTGKGPQFGESDSLTNIEKLILYVDGELQTVLDAGEAATSAADRANAAAESIEDFNAAMDRANTAATRAENAAAAVEDLEGAVNRANAAAEAATNAAMPAVTQYGLRVKGEVATATGNPVTFLPDAGSLLDVTTVFEPKQEGDGEPSLDNIRTIVGYKTLELTHTGKNLFGVSSAINPMTSRGVTLSVLEDGSIVLNGTASGGNATFNINLLKPIPAGAYTISLNNATATSDNNSYAQFRDSAGSVGLNAAFGKDYRVATGALSRDATSVRILIKNGETLNGYKLSIQVERGEATSYVPYFAKTYTLSLEKTVYGGRFVLVDGKLIQEWDLISEYAGESLPGEWVSDRDVYAAGTTPTIGAQVAYKMATPVSEHLSPLLVAATDPEQENTLSGDGVISVDYVKPLHVSIDERVAAAVAAAMNNG